ncbi:unnamed protein product [Pleuronectes platessa]|uniref:Uncharacterized protein n=1 Tax=Pleuronectes platessa TaxID=8262 RepID=A0A9N7UBE1_PLEPL|nr:unnamed protein product [Pleuronectes platessa]
MDPAAPTEVNDFPSHVSREVNTRTQATTSARCLDPASSAAQLKIPISEKKKGAPGLLVPPPSLPPSLLSSRRIQGDFLRPLPPPFTTTTTTATTNNPSPSLGRPPRSHH